MSFIADRVPTQWGLEFAGVLALLGVTYSLLQGKQTWIAAGVAACAAVAAFGLPLKLNIVVGDRGRRRRRVVARARVPDSRRRARLMASAYTIGGVIGLAVITVLARGFFMLSERELTLPAWAMQGLRYAPLAALVAVIAPEIVLTDGALIATWADARIYAVLVGTAYFYWRRDILGMIVSGTAVLLALNIGLGW